VRPSASANGDLRRHPGRFPRFLRLALLACIGPGAALLLGPTPAAAAPTRYAALGDSYSSGVGTRAYFPASGACHRSPFAHPEIIAHRLGWQLAFAACANAKTGDVLNGQLNALNGATQFVSISIGGNDASFGPVIQSCVQPLPFTCSRHIAAADAFIGHQLPGLLDHLFAAIRARAPHALVAVVGYPRLFVPTSGRCGALPPDQVKLNHTGDLLAGVTGARAHAHGFLFVDVRGPFTGHAICSGSEWLNGLSLPLIESFHPNRVGQAAYADLVQSDFSAPHH
jgi:hypothetical protein